MLAAAWCADYRNSGLSAVDSTAVDAFQHNGCIAMAVREIRGEPQETEGGKRMEDSFHNILWSVANWKLATAIACCLVINGISVENTRGFFRRVTFGVHHADHNIDVMYCCNSNCQPNNGEPR